MPTINVYNMEGKVCGEVALSEKIFAAEINNAAVHSVVRAHLLNCRQGTQSTLTRSEVSGGGRKPWKQKGTGRARQGSTRAPQWTHGGIVFAPKPRDYSYVLNKKGKAGLDPLPAMDPRRHSSRPQAQNLSRQHQQKAQKGCTFLCSYVQSGCERIDCR